MSYVLQVDFKMNGPFGDEMAEAFSDLAKSINEEDGFMWKIWTENSEKNEAGGIYLFETKETAEKYNIMHTSRLADFGITDINAKIFSVNPKLTEINKGPAYCNESSSPGNPTS
ncbi:monooxygenase [Paenibacillus sp. FSL K6-3182]|uniref:monooxygenase n=1 Tax=unclassified Paenibacillus TaxID=185978 RepID=UPI0030CBBD86